MTAPDQPAEPAANQLLTAPKSPADDLRQQLADAIRTAADTHEPACGDGDCECDLAILSPMFGNGPTTRVEGSPDGLAQVCAAVVQPALDAKDAQIARLTRELTSLAQATHDLDQKAIDAYEERDAAQQRAEDAEAETARLTAELAQARADLGRYDHYATQIGAKELDT